MARHGTESRSIGVRPGTDLFWSMKNDIDCCSLPCAFDEAGHGLINESEYYSANATLMILYKTLVSRRIPISSWQSTTGRSRIALAPFRPFFHEITQTQIFPSCATGLLRRALDAKRRVLIGNNVVLILRIDGLVLWRNVDLVVWELVFAEIFKEVRMALLTHVNVRDS